VSLITPKNQSRRRGERCEQLLRHCVKFTRCTQIFHAFWLGEENHLAVLLGFPQKARLALVVLKIFQKPD